MRAGRTGTVLIVAALLALSAAAVATAATFTGETSQDTKVRIGTTAGGIPQEVMVRWRSPCDRGHFRGQTIFRGSLDVATSTRLRDAGRYTERDTGGYRYRITAKVRGRRVAKNRWSGRFESWVRVLRRGNLVTLCRSGTIRWTARKAS